MFLLDLTLDSPAENLAVDEALLDWAEEESRSEDASKTLEALRLWEPPAPFVVLGRSSRVQEEVDMAACRRLGIPVLRRSSGGGTVVLGPGCLMYAVVLSYGRRPELRPLDVAHRFVLSRIGRAVAASVGQVTQAGTSDLAVVAQTTHSRWPRNAASDEECRKFSGNSLRCKRTHFVYHGTLMYDFDLRLIEACLPLPSRRPEYRANRSHSEFLANLPTSRESLRRNLIHAWHAVHPLRNWPREATIQLAQDRYATDAWTFSR